MPKHTWWNVAARWWWMELPSIDSQPPAANSRLVGGSTIAATVRLLETALSPGLVREGGALGRRACLRACAPVWKGSPATAR